MNNKYTIGVSKEGNYRGDGHSGIKCASPADLIEGSSGAWREGRLPIPLPASLQHNGNDQTLIWIAQKEVVYH